jgi:hypothetical protein
MSEYLTRDEALARRAGLIAHWTRYRDDWQHSFDTYDASPYAGTFRGTSKERYMELIADCNVKLRELEHGVCPTCYGVGEIVHCEKQECPTCAGRGTLLPEPDEPSEDELQVSDANAERLLMAVAS